jgi:transposase
MNIRYATEKGAMMKNTGEDSPRHKYTKNQINQVIHMLEDGNFTAKEISAITGVHVHAVRDLKNKRTWIDDVEGLELGLKSGIRKFSDEQIHKVIQLLDGTLTVKEISDITGVSKSVVRGIYKREIYTYLTDGVRNLSYKKISTRANKDIIIRAIALLETRKYTCSDIQNITGLSRSVIEKLAYHQRWQFLTEGKRLGFKGSVK